MKAFATLIDAIGSARSRNAKLALLTAYFRNVPDPDRGHALAVLTGALTLRHARPALLRRLIAERTDPVLFALSYDYVGDLSETIALMWPGGAVAAAAPTLAGVIETLDTLPPAAVPDQIVRWLDGLDDTGRWALLKLITGGLRIGVSARLAKTAVAMLGPRTPDEIEEIWHGQAKPYTDLFAFAEGRRERLDSVDPLPFRTPMLAHPIEAADLAGLDPADHVAEWKWDGIRVQLVGATGRDGEALVRLYSRSGDEITAAFPDLADAVRIGAATIDGELLVIRDGRVMPFADIQQRLNRKRVPKAMLARYPAHLRAYDLLSEAGTDLRPLPFTERRMRLEALVARHSGSRLDASPLVAFASLDALAAARANPAAAGAGENAGAVEGVMIKRRDSAYVAGRPRGLWWKWKRAPDTVDAVMMYAQRGHGKRSSFYSDYTFGVWKDAALVPVGKAYSGFTDAELRQIDAFVRTHTTNRFGPVREVSHTAETGLVLEIAFEGLNRSTRHKSGLAMRFPRILRLRWDKRPAEAGTLEDLEARLDGRG